MKHAKCYVPSYPRIQFVRNNWESLNGEWDFAFLPEDFRLADFSKIKFDKKIKVPYAYQCPSSGIGSSEHHTYIAYRKYVDFDSASADVIINFEAVDYEFWLYVNGKYVGTHKGGYTRSSFEISSLLVDAPNEIVLIVKDDNEADRVRGKQSWMSKPWGCWYTPTSGIWKTVWLERVPHTRLNYVHTFPIKDRDSLFLEYDIENFKEGLSLSFEISYAGNLIQRVKLEPQSEHGNIEISLKNKYEPFKVQLWAPEYPNIFDLEYSLQDKDVELDHIGSYTAYKSFERKGSLLYLNNNPIFMKMVLFQGYYGEGGLTASSEKEYEDVVSLCKQIGINGIRMHQKLEDELFYYYCDMMGVMTFLEVPSPYEFSERTIANIQREFMEALSQYSNHPSIVCYVPVNESWGLPHISTNEREMNLASSLYFLAKSYDPNRLCIDNDGWEHTEHTDIISLHNYDQDSEKLNALYKDIESVMKDANNTMSCRSMNDIGYSYKGQPIMIDEFVGTSYATSDGWGYGSTVKNDEEYEERLTKLVAAVKNNPYLAGFCITQFNDVEQETNGLFDKAMKPKLPLETFKKIIE